MGFNCYYDVKNLKMQNLTTFLSRDMHCWQLVDKCNARWTLSLIQHYHQSQIKYFEGSAHQSHTHFLLMLNDIIFHQIEHPCFKLFYCFIGINFHFRQKIHI